MNSGLVPTSIVDKNGRQTTVHRKPQDGPLSALKGFPAPAPAPASLKSRTEQNRGISELFSERYKEFVASKLENLSSESVEIVGKCAEKLKAGVIRSDLNSFAHTLNDIDNGAVPEEILPYLLRGIDKLTIEFNYGDMKNVYLHCMKNGEPAPDEVLDAHLSVAQDYFSEVLAENAAIPFKYVDNKVLFDMVGRHPDKADIILKHRKKYMPEFDGPEAFEADLDEIAGLNRSINEGWL